MFFLSSLFSLYLLIASPAPTVPATAVLQSYFDSEGFTSELVVQSAVSDTISVSYHIFDTVYYTATVQVEGDPLYVKFTRFTFRPSIGPANVSVTVNGTPVAITTHFNPVVPDVYRYAIVENGFVKSFIKFHMTVDKVVEIKHVETGEVFKRYDITTTTVLTDRIQLPGLASSYQVYVDGEEVNAPMNTLADGFEKGVVELFYDNRQNLVPVFAK